MKVLELLLGLLRAPGHWLRRRRTRIAEEKQRRNMYPLW